MRAGPLSDDRVIARLNACFVPVFISNEDYRDGGSAPAEERTELARIYRQSLDAGFSTGTVHVYLLDPKTGTVFDTRHVAQAAKTGELLTMLEQAAARMGTTAGTPVLKPRPQSNPPKLEDGQLALHLVARGSRKGSWREFPGENWIVLDAAAQQKLLPGGAVRPDQNWTMDADQSARLLAYFYPQTENNNAATERIERHALRGTVESIDGNRVRARLTGEVTMKHAFYPGREKQPLEVAVEGYVEFCRDQQRIEKLRLVTREAKYGDEAFGVAVREAPGR
jgi:hypothetical protein